MTRRNLFNNILAKLITAAGVVITIGETKFGPPRDPVFKIYYWIMVRIIPESRFGPWENRSDAEECLRVLRRDFGECGYVLVEERVEVLN